VKFLSRAETVNATDWPSLYKSVPAGLTMDAEGRRMVPKNHDALRRLQQGAADAVGNLTSTFGDCAAGKDIDAYSLASAASQMESVLKFGAHDPIYGTTSANFRRAVVQLNWWLEKSRRIVAATEEAVARFVKAEVEVRELLASITPQDGAASAQKVTIPKLPPPQRAGTSSYTDFDPREPAQQRPSNDGVKVTPVGAGDGFRIGVIGNGQRHHRQRTGRREHAGQWRASTRAVAAAADLRRPARHRTEPARRPGHFQSGPGEAKGSDGRVEGRTRRAGI
jgi:hypothetical protein